MEIVNVALHLPAAARNRPHALAVVCPAGRDRAGRRAYTHLTCQQLDAESDRLARGLHALGVRRGTRTALMVPPSLEFFALTFALFKLGSVLVLIDPGMGVRHLGRCLGEAEPEAFIGVRKAHARPAAARVGEGQRAGHGRGRYAGILPAHAHRIHRVGAASRAGPSPARLAGPTVAHTADVAADETAAILFTSGSTGPPRGPSTLTASSRPRSRLSRRSTRSSRARSTFRTFPLFALFAPALGMTAIVPDMDPTRPARVDRRESVEAINDFGPPTCSARPRC